MQFFTDSVWQISQLLLVLQFFKASFEWFQFCEMLLFSLFLTAFVASSQSRHCSLVGDRHLAIQPRLASSPPAALASSASARRVQGRHPRLPGIVWTRSQLPRLDDCCFVTDARPTRLRSADTRTLLVCRTWTNFPDRALSASGPWESGTTCQWTSDSLDLSYIRFRQSLRRCFCGTTAPFVF